MKRYLFLFCLFTLVVSYGQESIYSIYKAPNKKVYAVGYGNIFMSSDTGKTWKCNHIANIQLYSIFFVNNSKGFVVGRNGLLYETTDEGNTWWNIPLPYTNKLYSICFSSVDTGFITGENGLILRTCNGGVTWTKKETNFHGRIFSIANNQKNIWIAVGDSGKILKSLNNGEIWTGTDVSNGNNRLRSIYFTDVSGWYIVGDNTTILKTVNDGQQWNYLPSSKGSIYINSIDFLDNSKAFIVGYDGLMLQTSDAGDNWSTFQGNTSTWLNTVLFFDSNTIMTAGDDGQFYVYNIKNGSKIDGQTISWINGNVNVLSNSVESYSYSLRDTNTISTISISGGILLNENNNNTFSVQWGESGNGQIFITESNLFYSYMTVLGIEIHDLPTVQTGVNKNNQNLVYQYDDILYINERAETIQILDLNGKVLNTFEYQDRISLNWLENGIYLAKINQGKSFNIFKIYKK